ncbi:unnamed protein product [Didymodactylos carnosus]|uniref:Uncharacterized protein n=1 Tax=Didymodactylos carnosus TaxID=1234261 RepID=A0A814N5X1_9BILA|nr:unnamed protein product [Didymodactylos carnosus]CAF1224530.1 unnamed protein product [Didymodactylos carnosus]CAF3853133.1 unnamed protein product [Didymodactylos carnosus]CAF4032626.1 unnamed protein product [Didymodactylos carnosus]
MLRVKLDASVKDQKYVALKSVSVDSKIRSFCADVSITQLFRNDEKQPIEAVYCFPIEENAAIYSFVAKVDDLEIRARLKEKVQAQQEYSQALQQGHGAYLLEQDQNSQDMFIINVGALLPEKECQIQIRYVSELDLFSGNKIRFVVPTTIAPRFNPSVGGISSPAGTQTKYVQSTPYTIDFRCQVDKLNEQITSISSPSHPVTVKLHQSNYEITFGQKNTFMDRDIIVDIELSTRTNTILAVEKSSEHQIALMASFTPTKQDCKRALNVGKENSDVNNEFIFIVDCSGSMSDQNKIGLAREAMILFLKSLPVNCRFNIIRFGSDYKTLFNNVTDIYNEQNARQAEQLISQMLADLGGTELLRPLQWLEKQVPVAGHSRQILLLTDGEISNVIEVMDLCRSMSTSTRIFSFGLGHSPSRSLIKGLARSTNGRFTFISPGTSVDVHVAEQLQKVLEPCITNVKVKWNIPSLSSNPQSVPTVAPPVYANDRLLFYALVESDTFDHSTTVELWNHEETVRLGLARIDHVPENTGSNDQLITHLAAKALIQEITHSKQALSTGSQQKRFRKIANQQQPKEDDNKKRAIEISLKYNILCPHTAFIGVETRTDPSSRNLNANMVLREIPIEISADDKAVTGLHYQYPQFLQPYYLPNQNLVLATPNGKSSCFSFATSVPPPPPPSLFSFNSSYRSPPHYQQAFCQTVNTSNNCQRNNFSACQSQNEAYSPSVLHLPMQNGRCVFPNFAPTTASSSSLPGSLASSATISVPSENALFSFPATNTVDTGPSLSSLMTEQKMWPLNDQDIVRHLINLQKFDGLWNLSGDDIQNLCQKPLTSFHSNLSNDSTILTSTIAIVVLETKFNSFRTMWSFIVNKGKKRLMELLGDTGKLEQLINDIKNQL